MAEFEAKVYQLVIEEHPNADALELARVGDYRTVVRKGAFRTGDLGVYIPEQAVLPEWLISELGLEGRLAGKDKNRVKAIKLRGILSQGLVCPVSCMNVNGEPRYAVAGEAGVNPESSSLNDWMDVSIGTDVTEFLGITKYEPPIPVHMAGEVYNAGTDVTLKYDVENFKKYPDVFKDGQLVYFSEKIHGTFMLFVRLPWRMHDEKHYQNQFIVSSKGLAAQGLALKHNEANKNNIYLRVAKQYQLYDKFQEVCNVHNDPLFILGEVYGPGVQDLQYGVAQNDKIGFRVFDVRAGRRWTPPSQLPEFCRAWGLESVPFLYRGPFSKEVMEQYTNGKETVSGHETHIREGIVIRPVMEQGDAELGRVILKSISEKYLLRKGGTEFN